MYVAKWARQCIRLIKQVFASFFGWCVIAPIAYLIPKRRDWIVVIGRDGGAFADNTKYFFLQSINLMPNGCKCFWITNSQSTLTMLRAHNLEASYYPSREGLWILIRSGTLIVDSFDWYLSMRRFLLCGAKKIQLWHGVGFKRIELDKIKNEAVQSKILNNDFINIFRLFVRKIVGRNVHYDLVNTTSKFYLDNVFRPAFSSKNFIVAGYPRNAFEKNSLELVGADLDVIRNVVEWKKKYRIVLVAPTFRESGASPILFNNEELNYIENWCNKNRVKVIFKFHPWDKSFNLIQGDNLKIYSSQADLYPLMRFADALVTDYSSIYMDFLLIDKPIFFMSSDIDKYINNDRKIQFDYDAITPGPKVSSWNDLLNKLDEEWKEDSYHSQRQELAQKVFDGLPQSKATEKLIQFINKNGWIKAPY